MQVAVALLSELVKSFDNVDRSIAVEMLKKAYQAHKLQPIRGKAQPPDIYDKEMATLYIIGKYGLKLDQEYPELFEKVFYVEEALECTLNSVLEGKLKEAREKLKELSPSGTIDSNIIARLLRMPLTKLTLGFLSEEEFKNVLYKVLEAFPEEERTVMNYAKFFVGLKLAELIFKGEVRSREEKEALKKALAIRIGFSKSVPSDEYVKAIAKSVFSVSDKVLEKLLYSRTGDKTDEKVKQEREGVSGS
ncbi:MAG: DUF2192 domain-containing protein [Desulfurococcaceae archaeon]